METVQVDLFPIAQGMWNAAGTCWTHGLIRGSRMGRKLRRRSKCSGSPRKGHYCVIPCLIEPSHGFAGRYGGMSAQMHALTKAYLGLPALSSFPFSVVCFMAPGR